MPFSFARRLERGGTKADLCCHAIVRGLALVALGMITNGEGGPLNFNWPNSRLPSVLGCIGLAYMAAAFIVLNTNLRGQFLWIAGILAAYWAALKFVPVPGYGAGDLQAGHTLSDYLDRLLIPGIYYARCVTPKACWRRSRRLPRRWPAQRPGNCCETSD